MTPRPPHPAEDAATAVELITRRVRRTAAEAADRFPLYADPVTGRWTTTRRGSWTAGFWAGLLWLTASRTGDPHDRRRAAACTARLRERAADDTDTRAFAFWYGAAAHGHLLCGDDEAAAVARHGAEALAAAWRPREGFVPAGTALGRGPEGAATLSVDTAGAVVALLSWACANGGRPEWGTYAVRHSAAVLEHCLEDDGAVRPAAGPGPAAGRPPAGRWPRGQAWGLLGLAVAAGLAPEPVRRDLRAGAGRAADWWLERTGGGVPPRDFADPDGPRDTSAAAIAAEALLLLAATGPAEAGRTHRAAAHRLLHLLTTRHLTPDAGPEGPPAGMLLDGCYDLQSGTAVAHELIWGDYFLLSALLRAMPQKTSTGVSGPGA